MAKLAPIGQVIDGRFLIKSELSSGGFGSLYVAEQLGFERQVAVKFVNAELLQDADALARFEREAKIIASLNHKNIAPCYAYGIWGGKVPYLVLELLHGATLRQILSATGPLSWQRSFSLGADLCSALAHAHAAGVVHRDIKPENIFITEDDTVKLLDFGLSHVSDQKLTEAGRLMGTVLYMSPEQAIGKTVTASSDIYALGCTLYESIAGHAPLVAGEPIGVLYLHAHVYPELLAPTKQNIPACVDDVLFRAMHKEPEERYSDALSFGADLHNAATHKDFVGVIPFAKQTTTEFQRPIKKGSSVHRYLIPAAVLGLSLFTATLLVSNNMLATVLLTCATAIPSNDRATVIESWGDNLKGMHRDEAAALLYTAATRLPTRNRVQRIGQFNKLIQTRLQQNYSASIAESVNQSIDCLFELETGTRLTQEEGKTILAALTLDLELVKSSHFGRQPYELRPAQGHVDNVLWSNKLFDRWEGSRELNLFGPESSDVDMFAYLMCTVMKLDQEHQYRLIEKFVKHQISELNGKGPLVAELRGLCTTLVAEANERNRSNKRNHTKPLVAVIYPRLVGSALSTNDLKKLLKEICSNSGDDKSQLAWQLAPLYELLSKRVPTAEDSADHTYNTLVQFVHGGALMQSGKFEDASREFINVAAKSDEIYLLLDASEFVRTLLSDKRYTPVIQKAQLKTLANILQLREGENRTEPAPTRNTITGYSPLHQRLLVDERARVLKTTD